MLLWNSSLLYGQAQKTNLEESNLKGKVKRVIETEYELSDEDEAKKHKEVMGIITQHYNRSGYLKEQKVYDAQGNLGYRTVYKYENNKRDNEKHYNSKNKITERWYAVYNDKGKLKAAMRIFDGKNMEKVIYTYNKEYQLMAENWYLNHALTEKSEYNYTENNRIVEKILYDDKESVVEKEISNYSSTGMLQEESKYTMRDALKAKTICVYNEKGQIVEERNYDKDNILESRMVFIYDDRGNVKEENWYDSNNQMTMRIMYIYTYDERGNWIEKKEFDNETKTAILHQRKITYYK